MLGKSGSWLFEVRARAVVRALDGASACTRERYAQRSGVRVFVSAFQRLVDESPTPFPMCFRHPQGVTGRRSLWQPNTCQCSLTASGVRCRARVRVIVGVMVLLRVGVVVVAGVVVVVVVVVEVGIKSRVEIIDGVSTLHPFTLSPIHPTR